MNHKFALVSLFGLRPTFSKTAGPGRRLQGKIRIGAKRSNGGEDWRTVPKARARCPRGTGAGRLVVGDFQGSFEVFGESLDFLEDFLRLFSEVIDHAIRHF